MPSRRAFVAATLAGAALSTFPASAGAQAGTQRSTGRRRILVFDVNETLLDINALEPHFARAFGSGQVLREWFSTLLLYSNVASLSGPYADFGAIAGAALDMVAESRGDRVAPPGPRPDSRRHAVAACSPGCSTRPRATAEGRLPDGHTYQLRSCCRRTATEERRTHRPV